MSGTGKRGNAGLLERGLGSVGEPELTDPQSPRYFALAPELLADQIVFAINQPWGVSISDLTVRATGAIRALPSYA